MSYTSFYIANDDADSHDDIDSHEITFNVREMILIIIGLYYLRNVIIFVRMLHYDGY